MVTTRPFSLSTRPAIVDEAELAHAAVTRSPAP
jgi:hypothetical protein